MFRTPLHVIAFVALVCASTPAQGSQVGTIFSGPTIGDGAAIYWNPGAMLLVQGTHVQLFGGLTAIRLEHQRATVSAYDNQPYPLAQVFVPKPSASIGLITDATLEDFRFGLGASLPLMDGAGWEAEYEGRPASTRYFAMSARLATLKIAPAVAYRITRHISVGVGLDIIGMLLGHEVMTDFGAKINQLACKKFGSTNCPLDAFIERENPDYDALTTIDGMGWGVGFFCGVLVTPLPWLRFGVGFHTGAGTVSIPVEMNIEIPKKAKDYLETQLNISPPPLTAQGEVEAHSPMIVTAGITVEPLAWLELSADLHWVDQSPSAVMLGNVTQSSSSLISDQVMIKDRMDDFLVGLRASFTFLNAFNAALRVEYGTNTRAEEYVTPVSVDFHKWSIHGGLAWQATRWLALSLEYGHYFMLSRTVQTSRFGPNPLPQNKVQEGFDKPSPAGDYSVEADRVGLGILLGF